MSTIDLRTGNCLELLNDIPDESVNAVITDPPYVGVKRDYGEWTSESWFKMMDSVVTQVRRILKPKGSAVFVLGPNMERVGTMRTWVFEFIVKWAKEWNWVQDVWWWNYGMLPVSCAMPIYGLMRPSVKACVWLGPHDCYRNQNAILWKESDLTKARRLSARCELSARCDTYVTAGGFSINEKRMFESYVKRGGVTPYNLIPFNNTASRMKTVGLIHHSAATPLALCHWWVRYITKPGDLVLDPFSGSATVGAACLKLERNYIGIEKRATFTQIAKRRFGLDTSTKEERTESVQAFFRRIFGETEEAKRKREALEFFKKVGL